MGGRKLEGLCSPLIGRGRMFKRDLNELVRIAYDKASEMTCQAQEKKKDHNPEIFTSCLLRELAAALEVAIPAMRKVLVCLDGHEPRGCFGAADCSLILECALEEMGVEEK